MNQGKFYKISSGTLFFMDEFLKRLLFVCATTCNFLKAVAEGCKYWMSCLFVCLNLQNRHFSLSAKAFKSKFRIAFWYFFKFIFQMWVHFFLSFQFLFFLCSNQKDALETKIWKVFFRRNWKTFEKKMFPYFEIFQNAKKIFGDSNVSLIFLHSVN